MMNNNEFKQIKLKPKTIDTPKKRISQSHPPKSIEVIANIDSSVNRLFIVLTSLLFSLSVIISVYFIVTTGVKETKQNVDSAIDVVGNKMEKQIESVKESQSENATQVVDSLTPVLKELGTNISNMNKNNESIDDLTKQVKEMNEYIKKN